MIFDNGSMHSNLNCLLHGITPEVQSKFLTKNEITKLNRLWHPWDREKVEYFTLGDLWNCYDEWSAYGAGVPMSLNNGETLVQYYVPYLSAIQIFTSNSSSISSLRDIAAESGEVETRDWFSDSCSDESDLWRWDGSSSSEEGCRFEKETILSQQQLLLNERLGSLYFQYFERSTPYGRAPLFDKIHGFSGRYPSLMSLRSVDLSPASWMAVAWYPIYHIPMGRTIKDLSTCFLTYHTLSSSFQDELEGDEKRRKEGGEGILGLAPFGLATYKLQGSVWGSGNEGRDQEKLVSLLSVADSWLKQLRVHHHDFNYFTATRRG